MIYEVFTDGATSNNGYENSYGGWAYAIYSDNELIEKNSDHVIPATNNICELTAAIKGCESVLNLLTPFDRVIVYSDSAYLVNCFKQKWYHKWVINNWVNSKKQPVKNKELWEQLIYFFEVPNFEFEKVKGHADNERNNFVDKLAVEAKMRGE